MMRVEITIADLSTNPRVRALQEGREPEPSSPYDLLLVHRPDGSALLHLCSLRALTWKVGGKLPLLPRGCGFSTLYHIKPEQMEGARADIAASGLIFATLQ